MTQPREADRIQCLVCGRWFRALPAHLRRAHEYTDEDYRLEYGIPVAIPLVCKEWSDNQRRRNLEQQSGRTLTTRGPRASSPSAGTATPAVSSWESEP